MTRAPHDHSVARPPAAASESAPARVPPSARSRWARSAWWVPWVLAGAGVVTQIMFPLTDGGTYGLTVAAVVLLAASATSHAALTRGLGTAAALVAVGGGVAFVVEAVGVRTGVPFGAYDYTGTLGPEALGVPLLVPLAWIMMAWPALLAARRLTRGRPRWLTAVVAAWALTAWDVFLDPQMVDAGHWYWVNPTPALPGVPGIPLTNFAGWLVVSLVIGLLLDRLAADGPDGAAMVVFVWTYLSSVAADVAFFGRPWVSLVGGLLMGLVAVPLMIGLVREHRQRPGRAAWPR